MRLNSHGIYIDSRIQTAVRKMYASDGDYKFNQIVDWFLAEGNSSDEWAECFLKSEPKELFDVSKDVIGPDKLNRITEYFENKFCVSLESDYFK